MEKTELAKKIEYVKTGGELNVFRPEEIATMQEFALDSKDMRLYDYLEKFWKMV